MGNFALKPLIRKRGGTLWPCKQTKTQPRPKFRFLVSGSILLVFSLQKSSTCRASIDSLQARQAARSDTPTGQAAKGREKGWAERKNREISQKEGGESCHASVRRARALYENPRVLDAVPEPENTKGVAPLGSLFFDMHVCS